jgi:hypothetical protein
MSTPKPSSKAGRKSLGDTTYITILFTAAAFERMEEGSKLQALSSGKKASRASWFRLLLDQFSDRLPSKILTRDELKEKWPSDEHLVPMEQFTVLLTKDQIMLIRQIECAIQSLDWSRHLYRNEICSILVESEGPSLNHFLSLKKKAAD